MSEYRPPLKDMGFCLEEFADLPGLAALPGLGEVTADLMTSILAEGGKLAEELLSPLNGPGDRQGSQLVNGTTATIIRVVAHFTTRRDLIAIAKSEDPKVTMQAWIDQRSGLHAQGESFVNLCLLATLVLTIVAIITHLQGR